MVKMTLGSLEQSPVEISLGNIDGKVPIFLKSVAQVVKEVPLLLTLMSVLTHFFHSHHRLAQVRVLASPGEVQAL